MANYKRLSKAMSLVLRHKPHLFDIILDEEGWVSLADLLNAINNNPKQRHATHYAEADVIKMQEMAEKQRFELKDGKIRALYGHSIAHKIKKRASKPPEVLYHGTAKRTIPLIQKTGLKSMQRQYVHLSADTETATIVGKRRDAKPIILTVYALEAHEAGIVFYEENNNIWLSEPIPPQFIEFETHL